jgi:hypothetical protein
MRQRRADLKPTPKEHHTKGLTPGLTPAPEPEPKSGRGPPDEATPEHLAVARLCGFVTGLINVGALSAESASAAQGMIDEVMAYIEPYYFDA